VPLTTRRYGTSGPTVVLVHGGPGAPGYLAPLARSLSDRFRVLEPLQRRSGAEPLTVARHVADLHAVVAATGERPAIVGHSWGAMLALACAAQHPEAATCLVLVGCGTFDEASREDLKRARDARMDAALRARVAALAREHPDADERLRALGTLLPDVDSHDLASDDVPLEACDARGHEEAWGDMLRLQRQGVLPRAFEAIRIPVLMLHGSADPHPGAMIRESLRPHLPQLEVRELERCGHYPWLERSGREPFLATLTEWIARHAGAADADRPAG
jgi:pimeloyl-ACP methyl ester carboxylesterase